MSDEKEARGYLQALASKMTEELEGLKSSGYATIPRVGRRVTNISSMRCRVSSLDETLRRELKIRHAAGYFWRTLRCFIWWLNTVSNAQYYFSNKMIFEGEIKDAKMRSFHLISKHSSNINFLCIFSIINELLMSFWMISHLWDYCLAYEWGQGLQTSLKGSLFNPIVTNVNFLLTISMQCQEIRSWELIKWSPRGKCLDLLSNSHNLFFKEMYGDQFGEFVCGYWGLKG